MKIYALQDKDWDGIQYIKLFANRRHAARLKKAIERKQGFGGDLEIVEMEVIEKLDEEIIKALVKEVL